MPSISELEKLINETHKHGLQLKKEIEEKERLLKSLEELNQRRWKELREEQPPTRFTMFDSVEAQTIPPDPEAVAGYIDGKYQNMDILLKDFPNAKKLSIAVFPSDDAGCLDIETGDATPQQAPEWIRKQHARGDGQPILYANLSTMPQVTAALEGNGIKRSEYKLWVADWTYEPHIPSGFDACQWTNKALERNLDESLCEPWFLP